MRTIIAGSRTFRNIRPVDKEEVVEAILNSNIDITTIISGGAKGVDSLAIDIANEFGIPLEVYHARWDLYGRNAGIKRNAVMAAKAEALIAVWDGISRGTSHMIQIAKAMGLKVYIYWLEPHDKSNSNLPRS
mgnify:CR=1 FL=1